jgi:hypothetical protein
MLIFFPILLNLISSAENISYDFANVRPSADDCSKLHHGSVLHGSSLSINAALHKNIVIVRTLVVEWAMTSQTLRPLKLKNFPNFERPHKIALRNFFLAISWVVNRHFFNNCDRTIAENGRKSQNKPFF